ncbi:MAG: DUF177 domain-containing protein [Actinobacteria bacterium]|nr:DUF177 domain-containing protein [Actinomycetota bacterium]MSY52112.1 DUF177 domain-containing protein [Actinomycetota bacterium]MSY87731.1 DUF177 domain-containing protein [Actinomycetota bacterium]MTA51008.1 DUF177 domain-containing protein [Actinomycetota bacterium]
MSKASPFLIDTRELIRRPGEMRESTVEIVTPYPIGIEVIGIPAGAELFIDLRLESVIEGVLVTATVEASAVGECARCLDPVVEDLDLYIQELYLYDDDDRPSGGKKAKKAAKHREEDEEMEADEALYKLDGELLDLEPPFLDAVVLALPFAPLCDPLCPGLCVECGLPWRDLPADHAHEVIDPRWADLKNRLDLGGSAEMGDTSSSG